MRRLVALAAVSALVLVGCGGGSNEDIDPLAGGTPTTGMAGMAPGATMATANCSPSGSTLTITASGTKFNTDCLAAPADQPFTVNFDNKDSVAHNLMILEGHSSSQAMFDAELITGPGIKTLNVPALKPGTYAFHCKIHPTQMRGTFIVK